MTDTGIEWMVAASGWKAVWSASAFNNMLDWAGVDFDVGYFSRFMRNIKQALIFRDEMHARGAVVYVCDERILSSDERGWDEWVREAHDAEAFSRKHSRRVGEGLEAKRRRLGVPGGNRPPLGYLRVRSDPANPRSPQQLIEDPEDAPGRLSRIRAVGVRDDRSRGGGRYGSEVDACARGPQEPRVLRSAAYRGGLRRATAGDAGTWFSASMGNSDLMPRSRPF